MSSVVLSLATSDGGSDATTPGSAGTPGIDFEAVAQELGLSPQDDAANKEYITNLKARQTSAPGFNLCDHHDERLRGKPRPKPTKAVEASRSLIIKELRDWLNPSKGFTSSWLTSKIKEIDDKVNGTVRSAKETKNMLFSLNVYTRNEIYREFNRDHRELRPDRWAALSRTMTCAVENTRSPATGTILYRGDDRESYNVREGQQDRFDQFTSTSTNPDVAKLIFSGGNLFFEIEGVPDTHCQN